MRTAFVSTMTLWNSSKSSLDKLQTNLVKANKEVVTGRDADVGLKLGYKTGQTLSLRQDRAELEALVDSNATALLRIKATTTALDQVRSNADKFMDALIATPIHQSTIGTLKYQAQANLNNLISSLNSNVGGQYIFGGLNSQEKPLKPYLDTTPASAAKSALDAAFTAAFGFSQGSAGVATITPAQMEMFLNGPFADLFKGANWQNWSNASDQNIQSRISTTQKVEASANANETGIRDVAMAYTMMFDLGIEGLNERAKKVLADKVITTLSKGVTGITTAQAKLGVVQEKIEEANERMDLQKAVMDEKITHLEAVDPAEAKIRIDQLMTQIQTSYSLTAQLKSLSLINYI